MAYAHVNLLLDESGDTPELTTNPAEVHLGPNHEGIEWHPDFEDDFEITIKNGSELHFDMGPGSGKKRGGFKTKIYRTYRGTRVLLRGSYSVVVYDNAGVTIAAMDPDYIIRPRV